MENIEISKLQSAETAEDILVALKDASDIIRDMDISLKETEKKCKIETSDTLKKLRDSKYFKALGVTIEALMTKREIETAKNLLKDLLVAKSENLGKFYEMMAYYFLISANIDFVPQVHIASDDCYKKDASGYEADGLIKEWNSVFDVKMFGIVFPHVITAEKKLQEKVNEKIKVRIEQFKVDGTKRIHSLLQEIEDTPDALVKQALTQEIDFKRKKLERMVQEEKSGLWNYRLKIDGLYDVDIMDMKKHLLAKLNNIADELAQEAWDERMKKWESILNWESENIICKHGLGFFHKKVEGTHFTCSLYSPISMQLRHGNITHWNESNRYEWAKNNRFYFMHDASQFVKNRPYIIICAFDKESSGPFLKFTDSLSEYLRTLCRRIFVDLNRMTDTNVDDGKAVPVSISEASKKITGILFLETSSIAEGNFWNYAWAYFNPNADNPLMGYQKNKLRINNVLIEDFYCDNY